MAELKTKLTDASVTTFLNRVEGGEKRADSFEIVKLIQQVTKQEPKMWGANIVGFGSMRLKYASGRELDWMVIGFSPRKQNLTLYIPGSLEQYADLLAKLGKHKKGGGCLYIRKLEDVNIPVLKQLIKTSVKAATAK
ncbi:MAG: DUF1801 domain-containing protein [Chloroflexi bacterium]|nr:DUF1801 domain-containing protein [Chloroflexota bacterium]